VTDWVINHFEYSIWFSTLMFEGSYFVVRTFTWT